MFGRRFTVRRSRKRGRRAVPFMPGATGVEGYFEDEPPAPQYGPTRAGEQLSWFEEEEIQPGGALMATVIDRPVLNRKQFIRRYKKELKEAYDAACDRLRAMGAACPNYAQLARLAHEMYREHRSAGSGKPVYHIIGEASFAAWDPNQPQEIMLRRMEKTWDEFRDEYKDLINLARADGNNPAFGTAASVAFKAYKAEPDRRKALEAARIAILEIPSRRRKTVSKKKKPSKPGARVAKKALTKTQRTAIRKPPGVRCSSTVGRKAATQQFTVAPKQLSQDIQGESKDVLLYRLQAEMSKAGKRRPRVISMLKRALSAKGLEKLPSKFDKKPGKPRKKAATKRKKAAPKKTVAKGKPKKPSGYAAALKRRFAGKASKKDNDLINRYNAKARSHAAKARKGKPKKQSRKSRVKESRGASPWNLFIKAFQGQVRSAGVPPKKIFKVLSYAYENLKGRDKTRAGQKPLIGKAISAYKAGKIKGAGKKVVKPGKPKKAAAAKRRAPKKKAAKPAKPRAAKGKSKPHKKAESKAKRAKGKIATDQKNLKKARTARDKAPASKKPAARKRVARVEAKLKKDKKELAAAKKSITLHKNKATTKKAPAKKTPTRRRTTTTSARRGKTSFRVKGNITVSA